MPLKYREARNRYAREWKSKNKVKVLGYAKKYREKDPMNYRKRHREWRRKNASKINASWRQRKQDLRIQTIKLLGGKCSNPACPIPQRECDLRALQIDHVHGGGNKHLQHFQFDAWTYYKSILEEIQKGSKDYQVLCVYCNWMKRYQDQ